MPIAPRLPAFAINGIAVALGIGLIQVLVGAWAGAHAAQLALSGAVCASLADVPIPAVRTWHRVSAAALLGVLASVIVALLKPHPQALGLGIAAIAFVSMMTMAWGLRAGAVSFAPILSVVFSMASPAGRDALASIAGWHATGACAYLAWSLLCAVALARRYRRLALAEALAATENLLRARADLLATPEGNPDARAAMRAWVLGEAALADRLQNARDFVFANPAATGRQAAMLLRVIDLRDVLLASRLDLELLGDDDASRWLLAQTATALRQVADRLAAVTQALLALTPAAAAPPFDFDALFVEAPIAADDPRARLLPALVLRLRVLEDIVQRIGAAQAGEVEPLPLAPSQLMRFVAPEGWPLQALWAQLRWTSPVARHALRTALALGSAYFIGRALPWASHPHWLVLSVAVVLRGNLEQTLSRRNARVLGTLFGCAVVVALTGLRSPTALALVFLLAVGTAHSYVNRRYWLTATAATVMALLQSHAVDPAAGFAVAERAADTVLGALLAWGFSYVLPSWERGSLPAAIQATLKALDDYAGHALRWPVADAVEPRMARRRAYDALGALAATLQRSRAEPRGVQVPVHAVAALLDHGQRLMAHLSVVRLILTRSGAGLDAGTTAAALARAQAELKSSFDAGHAPAGPVPPRQMPDADELRVLPTEAPGEDLQPWLERRLQGLARDARLIRFAAASALEPANADTVAGARDGRA